MATIIIIVVLILTNALNFYCYGVLTDNQKSITNNQQIIMNNQQRIIDRINVL